MADEKQSKASKFGEAVLWGGGFAIGSLIVGGLLKLGWNAITKKDDTKEIEGDEPEDD